MAERVGYDTATKSFKPVEHDCSSFDPETLRMIIANGFFQEYGRKRESKYDGWKDPLGTKKYDEAAVEAISKDVLAAYEWEIIKPASKAKSAARLSRIRSSPRSSVCRSAREVKFGPTLGGLTIYRLQAP